MFLSTVYSILFFLNDDDQFGRLGLGKKCYCEIYYSVLEEGKRNWDDAFSFSITKKSEIMWEVQ